MKRIIFILIAFVAFAISTEVKAQTVLGPVAFTWNGDSVVDAGTDSLILTNISNNNKTIAVQFTARKISGTVAGTCVCVGTVDGFNYVAAGSDTLTLANQAVNTKLWTITSPYFTKIKVSCSGGTTTHYFINAWGAGLKN